MGVKITPNIKFAFKFCSVLEFVCPTIPWEKGTLYLSGSFVLVRHYVQPGTTADSGLTFYTLYMHLAPYSAYASQTDPRQRITKGGVKFYLTKEDVASNKVAGKFPAGNVVTLCDETMVRNSDNHQFSQVKMQDGRLVWTVSDGGFLKMAESNGASPPPWWSQCSPAFNVTPPTAAVYKNKTALNYYRCNEDVVFETVVSGQNKKSGKPASKLLPVNTQMTMETDNAAQTVTRPDKRVFKLMTMTADVAGTPLKRGERVWVVADGGNLEAVTAQSGSSPKFDEVVTGQTIPVKAGAALGHLGFFQIPTETGFRSRYMVHIECLTSDSKVASFLTNPEAAGRESPAFLKYPAGAKLFSKDAKGTMAESSRKTKAPGILTLSKVPAVSADGIPTHYQIRPEGGFLAADSVEKLSQFDLGKLGFSIIKDDPESFQLLDAENQPQNVVKGIFEKLKAAAEDDPVFSNALASHKYKQLLDVIDQNHDGYYSVDEYRNAVHNPAYRDPLYQLIVQHPSEWYYEKTDAKWTKYLEKLEPDASKWKKYTEAFLDKMIWMKKVAGMGPAPWHMHPVMFMNTIRDSENDEMDTKWLKVPKGQLTFNVEGNDIENSIYFSRHPHVPNNKGVVLGISGVTFGRGLDLGQQSKTYINTLFMDMERDAKPLPPALQKWLLGSVGLKGSTALTYCLDIDKYVPRTEQYLTRKQQHFLFNAVYENLYDVTKRVISNGAKVDGVQISAELGSYSQKVQDVLVYLTFRGDNSPRTRRYFMKDLKAGEDQFKSNISNSHWKSSFGVPEQRFNERKGYL